MAVITLDYIPYNTEARFLALKQQYISIDHWRAAFFIHVYASMLVLAAGFTQFSKTILQKNPQLHRLLGYVYVGNILLITGPAGLLMGFYANGGTGSRIGFVLLALLWLFTTTMALVKAKQKKFKAHRQFMMRSFALTLSAITLRIWKYTLGYAFDIRPMDLYRIVAWLGFVPNLLFVEWLIWRERIKKQPE
jgi:putative Mn2+ efflux pump MntP